MFVGFPRMLNLISVKGSKTLLNFDTICDSNWPYNNDSDSTPPKT